MRKPPLSAQLDASRPAAAGRHDIVEEADAGGLWSEVDGLLTIDFSTEMANLDQAGNYLAGAGPNGLDPSQIPLPPEMAAAAEAERAAPPTPPEVDDLTVTIQAESLPLTPDPVAPPSPTPPTPEPPSSDSLSSGPPRSYTPPSAPSTSELLSEMPTPEPVADTPTVVAGSTPPSVFDTPPSILRDAPSSAPPRPARPVIEEIDPVETIPASAFTFDAPVVAADDDTIVLDAVVVDDVSAETVVPPRSRPTPSPTVGVEAEPDVDATQILGTTHGFNGAQSFADGVRLDVRPANGAGPGPTGPSNGGIDPLLAPVPVSGAQNFDFFREATGNQMPGPGGTFGPGPGLGTNGAMPRARSVEPPSGGFGGSDRVRDIIDRRLFAGVLGLLAIGAVGLAGWFVTTQFGGEGNRSEAVLEDPLETTTPDEPSAEGVDGGGGTLLPPTTFAITTSTVTNTAPPPTQPRPTAAPTTGGGTTASSAPPSSAGSTTASTADTTTTTRRTTTSATSTSTTAETTTTPTTAETTTTPTTAGPTTTAADSDAN